MKITIDTKSKIIQINDDVNADELLAFISKFELNDYTIQNQNVGLHYPNIPFLGVPNDRLMNPNLTNPYPNPSKPYETIIMY